MQYHMFPKFTFQKYHTMYLKVYQFIKIPGSLEKERSNRFRFMCVVRTDSIYEHELCWWFCSTQIWTSHTPLPLVQISWTLQAEKWINKLLWPSRHILCYNTAPCQINYRPPKQILSGTNNILKNTFAAWCLEKYNISWNQKYFSKYSVLLKYFYSVVQAFILFSIL